MQTRQDPGRGSWEPACTAVASQPHTAHVRASHPSAHTGPGRVDITATTTRRKHEQLTEHLKASSNRLERCKHHSPQHEQHSGPAPTQLAAPTAPHPVKHPPSPAAAHQ